MLQNLVHCLDHGQDVVLEQVRIGDDGRDENWVGDFLFKHPAALPLAEIDPAFAGAIPICRELRVRSGRIDALFATPDGALIVVECKLWRNPEARREVVAQILDYAKDLARLRYEELQASVSAALRRKEESTSFPDRGDNAVFMIVAASKPGLSEARFHDNVARNLARGRFLLLIVGDGIQQGTEALAQYVSTSAGLHFTLGLVELVAYRSPTGGLLIQPRLLARTVNIERAVVRLDDAGAITIDEPDDDAPTSPAERLGPRAAFDPVIVEADRKFWANFKTRLRLDDPGQPPPVTGYGRARLDLIPGVAWINLYSMRSGNRIGASCVLKGDRGRQIFDVLLEDRDAINEELAETKPDVGPSWGPGGVGHHISVARNHAGAWRDDLEAGNLDWLIAAANVVVNSFRPRILHIAV